MGTQVFHHHQWLGFTAFTLLKTSWLLNLDCVLQTWRVTNVKSRQHLICANSQSPVATRIYFFFKLAKKHQQVVAGCGPRVAARRPRGVLHSFPSCSGKRSYLKPPFFSPLAWSVKCQACVHSRPAFKPWHWWALSKRSIRMRSARFGAQSPWKKRSCPRAWPEGCKLSPSGGIECDGERLA